MASSIIAGSTKIKRAKGEYDFAVDGGAVGTITLRSSSDDVAGNSIPQGAVILGGYIEIDTAFASATGTVAAQAESAGDLQAAAAASGAPWSTTGRKSITPAFTGATLIKTTADRNLQFVIGTAALTAGKGRVVVEFI